MSKILSTTVIVDSIPEIKLHLHQLKANEMSRFIDVPDDVAENMQFEPEFYDKTFQVNFPKHLSERLFKKALGGQFALESDNIFNHNLAVVSMEELEKFVFHHLDTPYQKSELISFEEELVRNVAVGDVMEMIINDESFWYMYDNKGVYIGLQGVKPSQKVTN